MRASLAVLVLVLSACGGGTVTTGSGGGAGGSGGNSGTGGSGGSGGSGGAGGGGVNLCPDDAKTVYVVDQDMRFSSFAPATKLFTDIGTLSCPAAVGAEPFSMAVDRTPTAWVLYTSGELFKVNVKTLACTKTSFDPVATGFGQFGMGFSSDAVNGTAETLFITGSQMVSPTSTLASLNVGTLQPTALGTVSGWPELTGTGDARLWGFFPSVTGSTPLVAQIDKTNAALVRTFTAPLLNGDPRTWAFAAWGGRFWIFLKRAGESNTTVYEMQAGDGGVAAALNATGRSIVGAGVSTCAPFEIN